MNLVPQAVIAVMVLHMVMIIAPGSDYALIMRTVGRRGKLAGIFTALGFGCGAFILLLIAILGINSLFSHYPFLMTTVRYAGAGWLFWQAMLCVLPEREGVKLQNLGSFGSGFINHFVNIEMVIFYIAVMGQLSVKDISTSLQLTTALAMTFFTIIWFILVAYLTGKIPNGERILNHIITRLIFGALFLVSAIGLVVVVD
jgi:threonine/homoserine/homoserine lactone efflux protein